jgi:hypothetical protein
LGGTSGLKIRLEGTNPASCQVFDAWVLWTLINDGTTHNGTGVGVGAGVGVGVGVGAGVGVGVGVGTGFGVGVGAGVGVGVGTGVGVGDGDGVTSGIPSMMPLRIGKAAVALTVIGVPTSLPMTGVMSENPQVILTTTGDPTPVPLGKLGAGTGFWRVQFTPAASLRTRFEYAVCTLRFAGAVQASGFIAAKLAASRVALLSVSQPRKTRPKSTPNRTRSRTNGMVRANSVRLWPRRDSPWRDVFERRAKCI